MYGITKDTQEIVGAVYMPTGIRQNVSLKGASFEPLTEDRDPVLRYNFEDEQGRVLSPVSFEPNEKSGLIGMPHRRSNAVLGFEKGEPITEADAIAMNEDKFNRWNKHILTKFMSEDEIIEGMEGVTNYQDFCKAVVKLVDNANLSPTVRLLVVLDYKQKNSTLPDNPPFIELMSVPANESILSINPKYHKLVADAPANSNGAVESPENFDAISYADDPELEAGF